jgi:pimeloyl-ACP methyl ester carboxylesterase
VTGTVFMIHGMWGTAQDWENYRPFFESRGYRCVVPTLPYHDARPGAPPDPRLGAASLLDYADALEREIRQLDEKPVIMGHSMGGLLAQILGARDLASSLVLLAPAAPAGIFALTPSVIRSFWRYPLRLGFWRRPYLPRFREAAWSTLNLLAAQAQRDAYARYVPESGRAIFEIGFWPLCRGQAAMVDASRVTCPVLVIAGGLDRITPASTVRKVAERYRTVSLYREFSGHGHWLLGEPGWQAIAEFAAQWLQPGQDQRAHKYAK